MHDPLFDTSPLKSTHPLNQAEELLERLRAFASDTFDTLGELPPAGFLLAQAPDMPAVAVIGISASEFFDSPEGKREFALRLDHAARSANAIATAIFAEAWLALPATDESGDPLPPSQNPDRQEVVLMTINLKGFNTAWIAKINRSSDAPFLEPWQETQQLVGGNMVVSSSTTDNEMSH
jgi:hypothetical protein